MADPNSSMSPVAVIVLTLVVLVSVGLWLGAVFYAGRQSPSRPGRDGTRPEVRSGESTADDGRPAVSGRGSGQLGG